MKLIGRNVEARVIPSEDIGKVGAFAIESQPPRYIVEMSEAEYRALVLCKLVVLDGRTSEAYYWGLENNVLDTELSNPLNAFRTWLYLKGDGNRLRRLADEFDKALHLTDKDHDEQRYAPYQD